MDFTAVNDISFVPVLLAVFFIDLAGINWGAVLMAVFLIAVTCTLLALVIAVSAKEVFEVQTFSNCFFQLLSVSYAVFMWLIPAHQQPSCLSSANFLSAAFDLWNRSAQRLYS